MDRSQFVIRLLIVKLENVLLPSAQEQLEEAFANSKDVSYGDVLFDVWSREYAGSGTRLRSRLPEWIRNGRFQISRRVREVMKYAHDHSPIRVALLSSGPEEWIDTVVNHYELEGIIDLPYCYDSYPHGTRRTLLQFLMNRFIAGRERTLFLGESIEDERLSDRENTRFRSLNAPPPDARNPVDWDWTAENLKSFLKEKQPRS